MSMHAAELATQPAEQEIDAGSAPGTTLLRHEPLGVVSVLTPWNFPHSLNVMKLNTLWPRAIPSCSSRRR